MNYSLYSRKLAKKSKSELEIVKTKTIGTSLLMPICFFRNFFSHRIWPSSSHYGLEKEFRFSIQAKKESAFTIIVAPISRAKIKSQKISSASKSSKISENKNMKKKENEDEDSNIVWILIITAIVAIAVFSFIFKRTKKVDLNVAKLEENLISKREGNLNESAYPEDFYEDEYILQDDE